MKVHYVRDTKTNCTFNLVHNNQCRNLRLEPGAGEWGGRASLTKGALKYLLSSVAAYRSKIA